MEIQKAAVIETDRLILRKFISDDFPLIYKLLNSPGWLKYIGQRGIKGEDDARGYIENLIIPGYEKHGFGFYLMLRKDDGTHMGMCGLVKRDTLDDIDIGFAILPEYEGKGYTTEAAIATMEFAKNEIGLKKIAAITVPYNTGSIRILEKLGMKLEKMINIPNDPEELMLYVREF